MGVCSIRAGHGHGVSVQGANGRRIGFRGGTLEAEDLLTLNQPEFTAEISKGMEIARDVDEQDGHDCHDHNYGGAGLPTPGP